jgi:calcineurin-like phosphoesterase family protein
MTKKTNILSLEEGQTLYQNYLKTPQLQDHSGEKELPIKTKIFKSMLDNHNLENANRAKLLIESGLASGRKVWVWSDTHFGHANIIKYTDRPFKSAQHMNQVMLANYLKVVQPEDLVLFGGDVAFEPRDVVEQRLDSMPGVKILVLGNHDFSRRGDYLNYSAFEVAVMSFVFQRPSDGTNILVTHVPIRSDPWPKNIINLHGHTHRFICGPNHINMCVEHFDFEPVLLADLINSEQTQLA